MNAEEKIKKGKITRKKHLKKEATKNEKENKEN